MLDTTISSQSRQENPLSGPDPLPHPNKNKHSKKLTFHLILSSILTSLGIVIFLFVAYLHFNEVNNAANNATKASNLKNLKDLALIVGVICSTFILYSTYTLSKIIKNQNPLKILAIYTALAALTSSILYKTELIGNLGEVFNVLVALAALFSPFFISQKNNHEASLIQQQINIQEDKNVNDKYIARENLAAKASRELDTGGVASRAAAVKILVNLADEWLEDENVAVEKKDKNCQNIIEILCTYIRSPFPLAHITENSSDAINSIQTKNNYSENYRILEEEREVREAIIKSIKDRLSNGLDINKKPLEGPWSKYEFDFHGAIFFYTLNLSNAHFKSLADFSNTIHKKSIFKNSLFAGKAIFEGSSFKKFADFENTEFTDGNFEGAEFSDSSFIKAKINNANLKNSKFTPEEKIIISFEDAKLMDANLEGAKFTECSFYKTEFIDAKFNYSKIKNQFPFGGFNDSIFTGTTSFISAEFLVNANFERATFRGITHFVGTTFHGPARFQDSNFFQDLSIIKTPSFPDRTEFGGSTFIKNADFSNATFTGSTNLAGTTFNESAIFTKSQFLTQESPFDPTNDFALRKARFSTKVARRKSDFDVREGSFPIESVKIILNNQEFTIPRYCILFDFINPETPEIYADSQQP